MEEIEPLDEGDISLDSFAELVPALKCLKCSFLTRDKPSLLNHYKLAHNIEEITKVNSAAKTDLNSDRSLLVKNEKSNSIFVLGNGISEKVTLSKKNKVTINVNGQHVKVLFLCGKCNKELDSREAVVEHMLKEHNAQVNPESKVEDSEQKEKAILKPTKMRRLKKKQKAKTTIVEKVQCDVCKELFANKQGVRRHMRAVHSQIKPFVCQVCGHSTTHKNHLLLHTRQHTGERPFACQHCNYRASDHNTLRRHIMRHLGVKPYRSPVCDYSSVQKHCVTKHLQSFHPDIVMPDTKPRKTPCKPEPKTDLLKRDEIHHTADDHKSNLRQCMRDIFLHEETSEEPLDHGGVTIPAT